MSLVKANGAGDQDTGFYNGVATQSLRSDQSGGTTLSKTLGTPTTRRRWTISFWIKRTALGNGVNATNSYNPLMGCDNKLIARFDINDKFQIYDYDGNFDVNLVSTMVFRDTSAFYNLVIVADIDGQSGNDRMKLYVNGVRQDWSGTDPGDYDPRWNGALAHQLLADGQTTAKFNGYASDITFLDGQAIGETGGYLNEFGEVKEGIWIPKNYSGSYGNNGFRLEFKGTGTSTSSGAVSSPTNVGDDSSGNNNHFAVSGLNDYDSNFADSPENNFPIINILHRGSAYSSTTTSEGALSLKHSNLAHASAIATMALPKSGKWYWETLINSSATSGTNAVGVVVSTYNNSNALSGAGNPFWSNGFGIYGNTGGNFGTAPSVTWDTSGSATTFADDDIIGVAYDADNKDVEWYKNGSKIDYNVTDFDDDGNDLIPASSAYGNPANSGFVFNFGQDSSFAGAKTSSSAEASDGNGIGDFYYTPPSGYLTLCTSNLPELTISPAQTTQAVDHFGTLTYSSDGNAVNIVSGANDNNGTAIGGEINFSPDWVWIKRRNNANNHQLFDTNRGTNVLQSNESDDESDYSSYFAFLSSSNGFRLPAASANMNANGGTYVAWNWKANGGTTSTNSNGSISSTVQANTDAGFSIVTYSGNTDASATIGHGFSSTPELIFVKQRDEAGEWIGFNKISGATKKLNLSQNLAAATSALFNDTAPTSTVFSVKDTSTEDTFGDGHTYVAYCFHSVEGYQKISSYEGNGDTDGTFVYTGFRPAWILYKNIDDSGDWELIDTVRNPVNDGTLVKLEPNNTGLDSSRNFEILSNGFKPLTSSNSNTAHTYLYWAFAEQPFKFANAR